MRAVSRGLTDVTKQNVSAGIEVRQHSGGITPPRNTGDRTNRTKGNHPATYANDLPRGR